uniref:1-phosphatidylinositol 4-kinase n=1 Tax=Anthurium amnicola TaxID=1678845 RepID=A0A1D1YEJ1_9ARAE
MFTTYTRAKNSMAIAVDQCHGFRPAIRNRRCRLRSFPHPDINSLELDTLNFTQPLEPTPTASNFHRSFSSPCWTSSGNADKTFGQIPRLEIIGGHGIHGLHALVVETAIAMASGMQLVPVSGGLGGAYCLHNRTGEKFAVLKPITEDPVALRSPILGRLGLRHSIGAGDTGIREAAAYLLDHGGFSGVPPTALVKVSQPIFHVNGVISLPPWKLASIQRFVAHEFDAGDLGPSRFSVSSVHRIGILDVRLLNIDRHAGNILVKTCSGKAGSYDGYANDDCELVPIDHGLCLPEQLDDPYFEWLHWPQASVPFSESEVEYISSLDPLKDAELIRAELPMLSEASIRILVLCTMFLKCAAEAGLCLADIGDMMTREFCGLEEGPSQLESLCRQAEVRMAKTLVKLVKNEVYDAETKEFQFDMDCADGGFCENRPEDMVDIPHLLQGKPPKVPKRSLSMWVRNDNSDSKVLYHLHEKSDEDDGDNHHVSKDSSYRAEHKVGYMTKSISFSSSRNGREYGLDSGNSCVSFNGMNEEEWGLFLEKFEELLSPALEARKSMGLKQRLGTSCKF